MNGESLIYTLLLLGSAICFAIAAVTAYAPPQGQRSTNCWRCAMVPLGLLLFVLVPLLQRLID